MNFIHRCLVLSDKEKEAEIKSAFGSFWKSLASDYLDPGLRDEFNSLKHGLRVQPGGFRVAFGLQESPGIPAPPRRMQIIGQSKFGSTTFILERIGRNGFDYRVKEYSRNWDVASLAGLIRIINMSINNVVSSLLILNEEDPSKLQFFWPEDITDFDRVWESACGTDTLSTMVPISEGAICATKAKEVENLYCCGNKESADNE